MDAPQQTPRCKKINALHESTLRLTFRNETTLLNEMNCKKNISFSIQHQ